VITVRDPRATVASACSLYTWISGVSAARARTSGIGFGIARSLADALTRGLEIAEREPERIRVVGYDALIDRPLETLGEIYAGFGIPFPADLEAPARDWLAANPPGRHGTHHYDLATYGLDEEIVGRLFVTPEEILKRIG
jgi:hypothetical protein